MHVVILEPRISLFPNAYPYLPHTQDTLFHAEGNGIQILVQKSTFFLDLCLRSYLLKSWPLYISSFSPRKVPFRSLNMFQSTFTSTPRYHPPRVLQIIHAPTHGQPSRSSKLKHIRRRRRLQKCWWCCCGNVCIRLWRFLSFLRCVTFFEFRWTLEYPA